MRSDVGGPFRLSILDHTPVSSGSTLGEAFWHSTRLAELAEQVGYERFFYEKVINVKADVAALLIFLVLCGSRHISAENFALGSLRSDDWQLGRPTAPPLLSVFRVLSPPNASSLPCCIDPVVTGGAVKGARKGRSA
jgi:hypothetical protein